MPWDKAFTSQALEQPLNNVMLILKIQKKKACKFPLLLKNCLEVQLRFT